MKVMMKVMDRDYDHRPQFPYDTYEFSARTQDLLKGFQDNISWLGGWRGESLIGLMRFEYKHREVTHLVQFPDDKE